MGDRRRGRLGSDRSPTPASATIDHMARTTPDLVAGPSPREPQATPAIVVNDLRKSYGDLRALDGLTLTIQTGEIFALLGPNGAGKTTAIEILEGYRSPDSGSATVLGLDPRRDGARLKRRIGVVLQDDGVYPGLTAKELLSLYASYYDDPDDPDALLDRLGLRGVAATRCRRLSGGQKRRLALALALVGRPELLFLDEPTTGMDPQARRATWQIIREARDRGCTVLITTHLMDEAERLADRVGILDHGRLIALDRPAALVGPGASGTVRLVAKPCLDVGLMSRLSGAASAREVQPGSYVVETAAAAEFVAAVAVWLRDQGITLTELRVGDGSLEDVFLRLTGRELRP